MDKCSFGNIIYKPDGVNEFDPCLYEEIEKYENVTVTVLKCKRCGNIEMTWTRQPNTKRLEVD